MHAVGSGLDSLPYLLQKRLLRLQISNRLTQRHLLRQAAGLDGGEQGATVVAVLAQTLFDGNQVRHC